MTQFTLEGLAQTIQNYLNSPQQAKQLIVPVPNLNGVRFICRKGIGRVLLVVDSPEGVNWQRQGGPFARFLKKGEYEIKGEIFKPYVMANLYRVAVFEATEDMDGQRQLDLIVLDKSKEEKYHEVEKLTKLLVFCTSARLQNTFLDRMQTLRHDRFFYYASGWEVKDGRIVNLDALSVPTRFKNALSSDHLDKGFLPMDINIGKHVDTPVYLQDKLLGKIWTIGGVKKANARLKLSYAINGADLGKCKCFILEDVPQEIKAYHEAGGIYVPRAVLEKYGASRVTGPMLPKGVFTPMSVELENEFPDSFVLSKNSFKGEIMGIAAALIDNPLDANKELTIEAQIALELAKKTVTFAGVTVSGWEVDLPMVITNLIVGYGISVSDKAKEDVVFLAEQSKDPMFKNFCANIAQFIHQDFAVAVDGLEQDDEFVAREGYTSVYMYLIEQISTNKDFDPCEFVLQGLKSGLLQMSDVSVPFKAFDILNVYRSYGYEKAAVLTQAVVNQAQPNELNTYLIGKLFTQEVPEDIVLGIARSLFKGDASTSKLDKADLIKMYGQKKAEELYQAIIDRYINGSPDKFDGLMNGKAKHVDLNGFKFYIPGGSVMRKFVFPEPVMNKPGEFTGRYFMGGPAYLVNELFKFIASYDGKLSQIPQEHLCMFYIWYYAKFQSTAYRSFGENLNVKGFGNKMIVPCYWSKDTIYCTDKRFMKYKKALFSKSPVLFNKGLHGVKYSSKLPEEFGEMTEKFSFALSSCVFVPVSILLAHQNDTDGDMARVMFFDTFTLPIFDGSQLPEYMKGWQNEYEAGERDLKIKFKSYVESTFDEMDSALREAVLSKRTIGRATNLANIINTIGINSFGDKEFGQIGDGLYMMVQDVIRGVKHYSVDSNLAYLSGTSFGQIYGAIESSEVFGQRSFSDGSKAAVDALIERVAQQVGNVPSLSLLSSIREIYPMDVVRGSLLKSKKIEPLSEELRYLHMYIGTYCHNLASKIKKPNYEYYLEHADSKDRKAFEDLLVQFQDVQTHLLFATQIEQPKEKGLLELFYRLLTV